MPEELIVPPSIEEIICRFDVAKEPWIEGRLQDEIGKARGALNEPSPEEKLGAWAEHLAFGLSEGHTGTSPWNTYFAPLASGVDKEGKEHFFPDIAGTPASVLNHWTMRARTLKNPVLKGRCADLVWEMTPVMGGGRRDSEMARLAIDAYIASSSPQHRPEIHFQFDAINRALDLAILLKDDDRIDAARNAFMALHRQSMKNTRDGHWWRAFDRLMQEKGARVSDDEKKELIADLEKIVQKYSDPKPEDFDPHTTEMTAQRLIRYYSRQYQNDDVNRLYTVIARASEHFASLSDAMLASAVLQTAVDAYRKAGLQEDSDRVRILMQGKIGESQKQMAPIGGTVTIKKDDVEAFLASVVLPNLGQTFMRLAVEFLPKRSDLEKVVKKTLEEAPLMAHITQKIMADDRVAAIVGSVEEDPFGRLFQQAKFTYSFSQLWLREALHRAIELHNAVPEHFVGWANRHGLFQDMSLLLHGVKAWFEGDSVKAVHVLIPQIEHAVRSIAGQLGKPVTKAHPKVRGASVAINMGDILYSDEITEQLGPDLTFYFLSLYADPRGLNLRNEVAHGLIDAESMHVDVVRLLIHTLLVLGLWKELAAKRR